MKEIPLTKGYVTKVDDEDFEWLNQWNWYVNTNTNRAYAHRQFRHPTEKNKKGDGKQILVSMHRLIGNTHKKAVIDHIDGDGLNNQKSNLRNCSLAQNLLNKKKYKGNGYKGVSRVKSSKKWQCIITVNRISHRLGMFTSEKAAATEYDKLARLLHGEFACLNFPREGENGALGDK